MRSKSLQSFKDKVRHKTIHSRGDSLGRTIADLNPLLWGWFGYFKPVNPGLFERLDQFIRRRLWAVLRKQERRPSMGKSEADHRRWTNALFADQGLFTLYAALETARNPDEETAIGEPCARGPLARFGEQGGREPFPTPINHERATFMPFMDKARNRPASPSARSPRHKWLISTSSQERPNWERPSSK